MSKKNKLTPNQDKYKELQKRLKRKLKNLAKRGLTPNRAVREEWTAEAPPQKVRKTQIQKLEEAVKNIYQYVRYYDPLKETYISGAERRKQERSEASRKGWEKRRERAREIDRFWEEYEFAEPEEYWESLPYEGELILVQLEDMLRSWTPEPKWSSALSDIKQEDKDQFESILNGAISQLGRSQVAINAENNSERLLTLANQVLYQSGNKYKESGREGIRTALAEISTILYGRPLTIQESSDLTELAETFNESE